MTPETFYHLYNHANGSEIIFRTEDNYLFFLQKYSKHINTIADTYAYCLMPNHIHFLIRIKSEASIEATFGKFEKDLTGFENLSGFLSKQFSNFFNSYAKAYNKMYDRKGSLFMRPFKRKEVDSNEYFTKLVHYIHANPVHHGFCKNIHDWKFSSYHSMLSDKATNLQRNEVLNWFGNRNYFMEFHQQPIDVRMALDMEF